MDNECLPILSRRLSRRTALAAGAGLGAAFVAACFGTDGNDGPVSVKDFGAKGDGDADDTWPINRAVNEVAAAGGGTVYLPAGTYRVASEPGIVLKNRIRLAGESAGSVVLRQEYWGSLNSGLIEANGAIPAGDLAPLIEDATPGTNALSLSSTSGIDPGDYLILGSDDVFSDPPDNTSGDQNRFRGEVVRVLSVDSSDRITLYGFVRDQYRTVAAAGVRKPVYLDGVSITDLSVVNAEPGRHATGLIVLRGVRNFVVDNVWQEGGDGIGINLDYCLDGQVTRVRARDFEDDVEGGRLGYGVAFLRATENVVVSACHWQNLRHAVTTGGANGTRGVPRNIVISDCTADLMSSTAFDTHVQGDGITFNNCSATNSRSSGFYIRSPNTHVVDCHAAWMPVGVEIVRCGHGSSVKGGVFRQLLSAGDRGGYGARIRRASRVLLDGLTIDSSARNAVFLMGAAPDVTVRNLTIVNPNTDGVARPAITQESGSPFTGSVIEGNLIRAFGATSPQLSGGVISNGIELSSAATGYRVEDNRVQGHSGRVVETNGSSGVVSDNIDLDES